MAKGNKGAFDIELVSYGRYEGFDAQSRDLPRIREYTLDIPGVDGALFGFIVRARKAKGETVVFVVERVEADGELRPCDRREVWIRGNNESFYFGEFVATPVERYLGTWHLTLWHDDAPLVEKVFQVLPA